MTTQVTVSERDLHILLGIVSDDRSDLPEAGLPLSLLSELTDQVGCDFWDFTGTDSCRQEFWFWQGLPAGAEDGADERAFWAHYRDCSRCSYPDRSGDLRSVTLLSDFCSDRQWHSTGMCADVLGPLGVEHMLVLCLPAGPGPTAGPGQTARLVLFRGRGQDFSERDRALLGLLRPHLHQAYVTAERRRRGVPRLTVRQLELLSLVAAGHTNAQIARRLGIAEGTVRTHLENIYGRLQVSSRTAAVTRAFPEWEAE